MVYDCFNHMTLLHLLSLKANLVARTASCGSATFCYAKSDGSHCDGAYLKTCSDSTQTDLHLKWPSTSKHIQAQIKPLISTSVSLLGSKRSWISAQALLYCGVCSEGTVGVAECGTVRFCATKMLVERHSQTILNDFFCVGCCKMHLAPFEKAAKTSHLLLSRAEGNLQAYLFFLSLLKTDSFFGCELPETVGNFRPTQRFATFHFVDSKSYRAFETLLRISGDYCDGDVWKQCDGSSTPRSVLFCEAGRPASKRGWQVDLVDICWYLLQSLIWYLVTYIFCQGKSFGRGIQNKNAPINFDIGNGPLSFLQAACSGGRVLLAVDKKMTVGLAMHLATKLEQRQPLQPCHCFYSESWEMNMASWEFASRKTLPCLAWKHEVNTHTHTYIRIYIYIYTHVHIYI